MHLNKVIQEVPFKLHNDLLQLPNDVYDKKYIHTKLYNWGNNIYNPTQIGGVKQNVELQEELLLLLDPMLDSELFSQNKNVELQEELLLLLDPMLDSETETEPETEYNNMYNLLEKYYKKTEENINDLFSETSST